MNLYSFRVWLPWVMAIMIATKVQNLSVSLASAIAFLVSSWASMDWGTPNSQGLPSAMVSVLWVRIELIVGAWLLGHELTTASQGQSVDVSASDRLGVVLTRGLHDDPTTLSLG